MRILSHSVKVICTNIVDSGLGMTTFQIFKKVDEDQNVTNAALSTVCNIVNDFLPLWPVSLSNNQGVFHCVELILQVFVEDGLMDNLVQLLNTQDADL